MLCSVCPPSPLSPVMGAILRDEPLCSGLSSVLTLRGYCHYEVGSGQIPRERVGREGDSGDDRKRKIRDKQKKQTKRKQSPT